MYVAAAILIGVFSLSLLLVTIPLMSDAMQAKDFLGAISLSLLTFALGYTTAGLIAVVLR